METGAVSSMQPQINFSEVRPFVDRPICTIPKYVFENCNQATCHSYADDFFPKLRERVKILTAADLKKMCDNDTVKYVKKGEEFDWVYGLDALEQEFVEGKNSYELLEGLLNVKTVMRYNGLFSRFANEHPGEFRKRDIHWKKTDFDINELFLENVFNDEFKRKLGVGQVQFFAKKKQRTAACLVSTGWITRMFNKYSQGQIVIPEETKKYYQEHLHELNITQAALNWIKEQQRKDGKLDLVQWFKARAHYFPPVETLESDLSGSLEKARKSSQMHPIERACLVWFDIVRIHISHEANKRTGKALASVMLLSAGYLPPKIGKEDEKEFLAVIMKSVDEENGHLRLTQFVAKMIVKTQKEFANLQV